MIQYEEPLDLFTSDTIYSSKIHVRQHRDGYRFGIDPILLGHFTPLASGKRVLDIGTGAGVIPLLLSYLYAPLELCAVELQPSLAALARQNFQLNGLSVDLFEGNFLDYSAPPFDAIFSNPPYRRHNAGLHADGERKHARHESVMTLEQMIRHASSMLVSGGTLSLVLIPERFAETTVLLRRANIEPKRVRFVHSTLQAESRIFLLEGKKSGKPSMKVEPPLIVYDDPHAHVYTPECRALLWEGGNPPSHTPHAAY
ncbi:tRNA1(Val) (adenine(37)-N6)-methyltransferase [Chrysiogenes arsenatis]|uniref:tRNA1(Val) (adenine(37)-N6)-methyltransferase n=1 Tax=Chrysiogenes arsenatis TaxID=309797 RepID=UPI0004191A96|nr:methyltransferase [Chrysiogenes arsenatis]